MRKLILGSMIAATLGSMALPAAARTSVDFFVNIAPPPVYREYAPPPRVGHVWVPGYWDWRRRGYVWVPGHWVVHRPGYYYEPVRWVYRGGRYHRAGGWRDADRDGVPNRYDGAPYDPYWR